jgi:superfamily II DNA or RNA helicase
MQVFHGRDREWDERRPLTVSTVETMQRLQKDTPGHTAFSAPFDLLVVDEAHRLGNYTAGSAGSTPPGYALLLNAFQRDFTMLLTATPFSNDVSDIRSLLALVNAPVPKDASKEMVATLYKACATRVTAKGAAVSAQIPSVRFQQEEVSYDDAQAESTAGKLQGEVRHLTAKVAQYLKGHRRVPDHLRARLFTKKVAARLFDVVGQTSREAVDSLGVPAALRVPKVIALLRLLPGKQQAQTKVVVVSEFASVLRLVSRVLTARGHAHASYTGDMVPARRSEALHAFAGKAVHVLLLSKKCGGVGLNLFGHRMVFMEPYVNQSVDNQVVGRITRLGQTHTVDVTYLLHSKTDMDVRFRQLQKMADSALFSEDEAGRLGEIFGQGMVKEEARRKQRSTAATSREGQTATATATATTATATKKKKKKKKKPRVPSLQQQALGRVDTLATGVRPLLVSPALAQRFQGTAWKNDHDRDLFERISTRRVGDNPEDFGVLQQLKHTYLGKRGGTTMFVDRLVPLPASKRRRG